MGEIIAPYQTNSTHTNQEWVHDRKWAQQMYPRVQDTVETPPVGGTSLPNAPRQNILPDELDSISLNTEISHSTTRQTFCRSTLPHMESYELGSINDANIQVFRSYSLQGANLRSLPVKRVEISGNLASVRGSLLSLSRVDRSRRELSRRPSDLRSMSRPPSERRDTLLRSRSMSLWGVRERAMRASLVGPDHTEPVERGMEETQGEATAVQEENQKVTQLQVATDSQNQQATQGVVLHLPQPSLSQRRSIRLSLPRLSTQLEGNFLAYLLSDGVLTPESVNNISHDVIEPKTVRSLDPKLQSPLSPDSMEFRLEEGVNEEVEEGVNEKEEVNQEKAEEEEEEKNQHRPERATQSPAMAVSEPEFVDCPQTPGNFRYHRTLLVVSTLPTPQNVSNPPSYNISTPNANHPNANTHYRLSLTGSLESFIIFEPLDRSERKSMASGLNPRVSASPLETQALLEESNHQLNQSLAPTSPAKSTAETWLNQPRTPATTHGFERETSDANINDMFRSELISLVKEHKAMIHKQQEEIAHLRDLLKQEKRVTAMLLSPLQKSLKSFVDDETSPYTLAKKSKLKKRRSGFIPINIILLGEEQLLPPFSESHLKKSEAYGNLNHFERPPAVEGSRNVSVASNVLSVMSHPDLDHSAITSSSINLTSPAKFPLHQLGMVPDVITN